jgi:tetratricopeptide (TPR) repeat protein
MATDTAALPSTAAPTDPTRHLWQVPVLLLGIVAFVCAWQKVIPLPGHDPAAQFTRDIAELKTAYEKVNTDPVELKNQLTRVAKEVESFPEQAPLARFHLGSGYLRLAEITADPDEAYGYWKLASQHFNLVTDTQLRDPNDLPKLAFRKAKVRAVLLPPDAPLTDMVLLVTVLSVPQPGEDAGETHRIIAELLLRLLPTDYNRAKLELNQYLQATGIATPAASLARARLRLGDLHVFLKEYEQARKCLEQIGTDAPPDVLPPAKALLARVFMAEGNFPDAAKEWEILRNAPGVPAALRLTAAYQLGVCRIQLRQEDLARQLFEEAAKGAGLEANAAAIKLADLHLHSADQSRHKVAADLLETAVKGIKAPAEYDPALIPLNEVQAVFELAITTLLNDSAYEQAMKAAEAYAAICAPGRDREKRAEILGAWGSALQKQKGPQSAWEAKFKAAADEFAALAAFQPHTEGKLDLLRRAASYYRKANAPIAAVTRLEEAAALKDIPESVEPALWLELADALLAANRLDDVFKIFNKVMSGRSKPLSTAARYRLARQFVDTRHPGLVQLGRALFSQIAEQENVTRAEQEFHERALTELANALIREGNFADAETRLRKQLSIYPDGLEAGLAKLLLGVCLLQRAAAPTVPAADAGRMRVEAVGIFKRLVAECDASEKARGELTKREAWLRLQAALRVLQTYQQMRKPRELLDEAAPLLGRYGGTVEELIILSLVYHAFKQLNDTGKALDIRDRMRKVFDDLPVSAFPQKGSTSEYSREYWLKVWFPPEPK